MKYLFCLFIFSLSLHVFSQATGIENGTWYLYNMIIDGEELINPVDANGNAVKTHFLSELINDDVVRSFETGFCNSFSGPIIFHEINQTFTVFYMVQTLVVCYDEGTGYNHNAELNFSAFFAHEGEFNYEYFLNDSLDSTLTITSENGDQLIYKDELLGIPAYSKEDSFSIYPNPVKDELFFSANTSLNGFHAEVFDVLGKLKISKQLLTNSINVQDLKKGVYFLLIRDNLGNTTTRKFIK